jgi:hypothetical protein
MAFDLAVPSAAVLAAVSGLLVAASVYAFTHQPTSGQQAASAIERGMAEARTPPADAEAAEDERLTGDANEAGYRWAERRGLKHAPDRRHACQRLRISNCYRQPLQRRGQCDPVERKLRVFPAPMPCQEH